MSPSATVSRGAHQVLESLEPTALYCGRESRLDLRRANGQRINFHIRRSRVRFPFRLLDWSRSYEMVAQCKGKKVRSSLAPSTHIFVWRRRWICLFLFSWPFCLLTWRKERSLFQPCNISRSQERLTLPSQEFFLLRPRWMGSKTLMSHQLWSLPLRPWRSCPAKD